MLTVYSAFPKTISSISPAWARAWPPTRRSLHWSEYIWLKKRSMLGFFLQEISCLFNYLCAVSCWNFFFRHRGLAFLFWWLNKYISWFFFLTSLTFYMFYNFICFYCLDFVLFCWWCYYYLLSYMLLRLSLFFISFCVFVVFFIYFYAVNFFLYSLYVQPQL